MECLSGIERGSRCQDAQHAAEGDILPPGAREIVSCSACIVCMEPHVRLALDADESKGIGKALAGGFGLRMGNLSARRLFGQGVVTRGAQPTRPCCATRRLDPGLHSAAFFLQGGTDESGMFARRRRRDGTGWIASKE